ncbi:MAG: DUF4214 domain-containing protein [Burkholderiales bacterium]|nr:DUF4214 domain-containing protein [Burkholderiales bacterium]
MTLSSCGGDHSTASNIQPKFAANVQHAAAISPADYTNIVQRVYVAYFGRPADSGGLPYFNTLFANANAPTNVVELVNFYNGNQAMRDIINTFGNSPESNQQYSGGTEAFVTAIYRNLFNRDPDASGKAFWVQKIDGGIMTRAAAAITIMAGASTVDAAIVTSKTQVAINFTNALDTPTKISGYGDMAAAATARAMLQNVSNTTDIDAFQSTVTSTIATLASKVNTYSIVAKIIAARCVGCHATHPTLGGYTSPPAGVKLETSQQILYVFVERCA